MPIFKLISLSQQYEGARIVLQQLDDLPPVQTALQQISREAPLSQIAKTLRQNLIRYFQQQDERIQQLELGLRLQTEARQRLEEQVEGWYQDPLQKQISAAKAAAEQSSRSQQEIEKSLRVTEEVLERERQTHAQKVYSLNDEIVALNRLVASQYKRLEDLTGSDTPK